MRIQMAIISCPGTVMRKLLGLINRRKVTARLKYFDRVYCEGGLEVYFFLANLAFRQFIQPIFEIMRTVQYRKSQGYCAYVLGNVAEIACRIIEGNNKIRIITRIITNLYKFHIG